MLNKLILIFLVFGYCSSAQLSFSNQTIDLGTINETYEIKGDLIIKNNASKKTFLMRADADNNVKVYTSKKTLQAQDTCLIVISFVPENSGKFKKKINLIASDSNLPYEITVSGNLLKLKTNDKTACFYFGEKKHTSVDTTTTEIVVKNNDEKKDNSNKLPDNSSIPIVVNPVITKTVEAVKTEKNSYEFSLLEYKPNNILFLVDISSSMKDSLKLPLMKLALHTLIDAVREVDIITLVTYADSLKIIKDGVKGSDKIELHKLVNGLKAKGLTKGNKAILFSQQLAQKHFITEGNNQIIMATDGKFRFYSEDYTRWTQKQLDKKIILSTVAFGNDKDAMKNLKEIAEKGEGSFIHIKKQHGSEDKLLEEIKMRSKR